MIFYTLYTSLEWNHTNKNPMLSTSEWKKNKEHVLELTVYLKTIIEARK